MYLLFLEIYLINKGLGKRQMSILTRIVIIRDSKRLVYNTRKL